MTNPMDRQVAYALVAPDPRLDEDYEYPVCWEPKIQRAVYLDILVLYCIIHLLMIRTFKFRLYPTKAQRTSLATWLGICSWIYNKTLEIRKTAWRDEQKSISLFETNKLLTKWKADNPWIKQVHSQVLQNVQYRVDTAFKGFFRRVKAKDKQAGFPRFRSKFRYDSICFPQYPGGAVLDSSVLRIRKIGNIRLNLHRPVVGNIKTTTITRTSAGKWFCCFSVEQPSVAPLPTSSSVVGIDVGLTHFYTTSTGEQANNPRFFRKSEKALAAVQRRFSRTKLRSPARRFRRKAVARVHERIRNQRADFAHKQSRKLVQQHGIIIFEDIKPSRMVHNRRLSKSISDAAWQQLIQQTTYKAEEAGRTVVLVNPAYTSQDCSQCRDRVKKSLSCRVHNCAVCGLVLDRDHNAALNIKRLGLQSLAEQQVA